LDLKDLANFLSTVGLPGGILIYLIWRLDKFLTFLCVKLSTFNKELGDINYSINGVTEELKSLGKTITSMGKK